MAYVNQKNLNAFAKKYKCKVEFTTFNTMSEALAKLRSGEFNFDVFVPTVDVLGQLVAAKLVRPLNHSYIPNITQAWTQYQNPFYDQQWQYTVPYTIYTTGIAWRKDHVPENPYTMANPWAMLWNAKYKGKVAILDDYRESLALGMMKNGILRPQHRRSRRAQRRHQLAAGTSTSWSTSTSTTTTTPPSRPARPGSTTPGPATWPRPRTTCPRAPRSTSWGTGSRPVGVGPVANDTMTVLAGGKNPVLAHLFLNYMLDLHNVLENISFNGYMQPINGVTPQVLDARGHPAAEPDLDGGAALELRRRDYTSWSWPRPSTPSTNRHWLRVSGGV